MCSLPLPRDVLLIVRDLIPATASGFVTHVCLSESSSLMREQIYDQPIIWQRLINQAGFSLSRRRLAHPSAEARPAESPAEWLALAHEIATGINNVGDVDEAVQVVGLEAGSEGVEARLFWGSVTSCLLRWLDQRTFVRPLSPEQVRRSSTRLEVNPYVTPASDTADGLLRLPALAKERAVVERGEPPSEVGWDGDLLERYPAIAHSFATCPPVTELQLWLGPTLVRNPSGVTVFDVRQAVLRAPRSSTVVCFLDIPPYKPSASSSSSEGNGSVFVGPEPPEWLLAHDRLLATGTITSQAWVQQEPGSIVLGEPRGLTLWTGGGG